MHMFCKNCGAILEPDSKFCQMCGDTVEIESPKKAKEPKKIEKSEKNKIVLPVVIGVLVVAIIAVVLILVLNRKDAFRIVFVNDSTGTVSLERDDDSMEIAKDMKLIPDDFVSVEDDSTLDLLVDDDKHIAVRSNTQFSVDATGNPKKGKVTIHVTSGKTYIKIDHPLQDDDSFEVKTPNATISVRGTIFSVDYDPNQGVTYVECVEGKVHVVSDSGDKTNLTAGERAEVVDVITLGTPLTQDEMDVLIDVFDGGDGILQTDDIEVSNEESVEEIEETDIEEVATEGTIFDVAILRESDSDIANANVGDIVFYGEYDGEPLAWDVLAMEDGEAYLICSNTLPSRVFDQEGADYKNVVPVSYEDSALRDYLIHELQDEIFTEDELLLLSDEPLEMQSAREYHLSMNYTKDEYVEAPESGELRDKIFLPSVYEIIDYYELYKTDGVDFVYDAYTTKITGGETDGWWLRTGGFLYGNKQMYVAQGDSNVWIDGSGISYYVDWLDVRPAIRVKYDTAKRFVSSETTTEPEETDTFSVYDLSGFYYSAEDLAYADQLELTPKGDGTFSVSLYIWRQDYFEGQTGTVDENGNIIFSGSPSGIISIDRGKIKVELTSTKGYLTAGMTRYFFIE